MSMENYLNEFIDELIQEVEQELEEATTTGNVAGYNTPFAFGTNRKKDKKKEKETATQAGYTLAEGLISPKSGHKYFQLTKDAPVQYIAGHSGLGLTTPGVLLKNIPGFIDGKKGAYLIDYHGALFYVDLKKKVAVRLGYDLSKQPKLRYKTNFIEVPQAPEFSDWKKYLKESVNEAKIKRPVNRWLELKNDETMHPHKKMAMGLKELKYQLKEVEKFFNWYNKIKTMNELDSQNYWKRTNNHIYTIKEKLIKIAKTIQEIEK